MIAWLIGVTMLSGFQVDSDNDLILSNLSRIYRDKYYTNGIRFLGYGDIPHKYTGEYDSSWGISLGNAMFTPKTITTDITKLKMDGDRPFAGFSYGSVVFRTSTRAWGLYGELQLGLLGGWSGTRELQSFIHYVLGAPTPSWVAQIGGDASTSIAKQVVWQAHLKLEHQLGLDLPLLRTSITFPVRAGNVFNTGGIGMIARFGLLGRPSVISPSPWPGIQANEAQVPLLGIFGNFSLYGYLSIEGRGVLTNATLEGVGDPARDIYSVTPVRFVADTELGIVLAVSGAVLLRASVVARSAEIAGKPWRWDDNAYVSLSAIVMGNGLERPNSF